MFITFEGGEGTGKTTLISRIERHIKSKNKEVVLTREPGGTGSELAEEIRTLVLTPKYKNVNAYTEALLYAASRAQHLEELIIPAIKQGKVVLCDRYIDSSIAYQAYARKLGLDFVLKINEYALNYLPDLTFFIDVDPKIGIDRIKGRSKNDRLDSEKIEFHQAVRNGYAELLDMFPKRIIRINGLQTIDEIEAEMISILDKLI